MKFMKKIVAFGLAVMVLFAGTLSASAGTLGIDVSKHQKDINWTSVRNAGVGYTFIKAGSTNSGLDPYFDQNMKNAQAAGLRTGVYIYSYAASVEEAVNEAYLLLAWIQNYQVSFPVAYDIEDAIQKTLDPNTVTAMCNAFCDVIKAAGYYPIVYSYTSFFKKYVTSDLRYDKWAAHYGPACGTPGYTIWQYTSKGVVAGINTFVDGNVCDKPYEAYIIPEGPVLRDDGFVYYCRNYRTQTGWVISGDKKYYCDIFGHMTQGFFSDGVNTYCTGPDWSVMTGLNAVGDGIFYFNEDGVLMTGWIPFGDRIYFFNPNKGGRMETGWFETVDGKYYSTPETGAYKGLVQIDNAVYYFNENGIMQTGVVQVGDYARLFDNNGKLVFNGKKTIAGVTYYTNAEGVIVSVQ